MWWPGYSVIGTKLMWNFLQMMFYFCSFRHIMSEVLRSGITLCCALELVLVFISHILWKCEAIAVFPWLTWIQYAILFNKSKQIKQFLGLFQWLVTFILLISIDRKEENGIYLNVWTVKLFRSLLNWLHGRQKGSFIRGDLIVILAQFTVEPYCKPASVIPSSYQEPAV